MNVSTSLDATELAQRCAQIMWENDQASRDLGIRLDNVDAGCSTCSLVVEPRHCNGHGICHGGFIFTLADTAFAFACNSHNQFAVAQQNSITFITPARLDDTLTAVATESSRSGRSGIYDVSVYSGSDTLVALFRGNSRTIKGQFVPDGTT